MEFPWVQTMLGTPWAEMPREEWGDRLESMASSAIWEAAVRTVLEADRHGEAARHFAVRLGFRGASADGRPGNQVRDILRHDGIEKFRGGGKSQVGDIQENVARHF